MSVLLAQIETPLEEAKKLSEELGNTLLLKREDLQAVSPSPIASLNVAPHEQLRFSGQGVCRLCVFCNSSSNVA